MNRTGTFGDEELQGAMPVDRRDARNSSPPPVGVRLGHPVRVRADEHAEGKRLAVGMPRGSWLRLDLQQVLAQGDGRRFSS